MVMTSKKVKHTKKGTNKSVVKKRIISGFIFLFGCFVFLLGIATINLDTAFGGPYSQEDQIQGNILKIVGLVLIVVAFFKLISTVEEKK